MKRIFFVFGALLIIGSACNNTHQEKKTLLPPIKVTYPSTKKIEQTDTYFGIEVNDPYRWLENDTSKETMEWVDAQNTVTFGYLEQIPFREKIKQQLTKAWEYTKYGTAFKKGEYYYFFKNDGLQNQSILYRQKNNSKPEIFLDPNTLSQDGTTSLTSYGYAFSKDHKYFAYSVAHSGSDWNEIFIMETETKKQLQDKLQWVKFSTVAWHKDGFFYTRFEKPQGSKMYAKNQFSKIYYHKIGTAQEEDQLIFMDKENPLRYFRAATSDDEKLLVIYGSEGTSGNSIHIKKLDTPNNNIITVVNNFENDHVFLGKNEQALYFVTNLNAPNNRIIAVDINNPEPAYWKDIISESDHYINGATLAGKSIIVNYLKDAHAMIYQYSLTGQKEKQLQLPSKGTVKALSSSLNDNELIYSFTSFTFPSTIFKYNLESNETTEFKKPSLTINPDEYETKQVFYKSKDGTSVPMFIVHKKGIKLDGNNPTFLYGYGGFSINILPDFSPTMMVWLENGGIYAQPNLRGGAEYGEKWHKAGMLLNKQNVFDDFIAAAEYLIKEKYTSKEKLAIHGRSNGGLLIGACMTQRPDLFQVALPGVGVLDMLRYHKFTIGYAWATEYGSSEDSLHFKNLYKYSPLHNVKPKTNYPATLIITADHDDRVVPAHSFKFAATLQENNSGDAPILIRIDKKSGHGAGIPTYKKIEEQTDLFSFTWYNLGINPFEK